MVAYLAEVRESNWKSEDKRMPPTSAGFSASPLAFWPGYGSQFIIPPQHTLTFLFYLQAQYSLLCCETLPALLCSTSLPGYCVLQARKKSLHLAPKSFFQAVVHRNLEICENCWKLYDLISLYNYRPFGFIPLDQMFSHCYSGFVHLNASWPIRLTEYPENQCLAVEVLLTQVQSLSPRGILCDAH